MVGKLADSGGVPAMDCSKQSESGGVCFGLLSAAVWLGNRRGARFEGVQKVGRESKRDWTRKSWGHEDGGALLEGSSRCTTALPKCRGR